MQFASTCENDKGLSHYWARITEMITGPDHAYVYLKRIITKIKEYYKYQGKMVQRKIKKKAFKKKADDGACAGGPNN